MSEEMARPPNRLTRWYRTFFNITIGLCSILLLSLSLLIVADVLYRAITGRPLVGVFEISELILLTSIFLACGYVEHTRSHIVIDVVPNMLRGRSKTLLDMLDAVCGLIVFSIILYTSGIDAVEAYEFSFGGGGMLQIPLVIPLSIIFVGSALMVLALVMKLLGAIVALGQRQARSET